MPDVPVSPSRVSKVAFPRFPHGLSITPPSPIWIRVTRSPSVLLLSLSVGTNSNFPFESDAAPNPFDGSPPLDLDSFDFTRLEGALRPVLLGRDDWLVAMPPHVPQLSAELDAVEDIRDIESLFSPYSSLIDSHLHCVLVNWLEHHKAMRDGGFEASLPLGLRNVLPRGNSPLRQYASTALAKIQCLDRCHSGDGGVWRIWRGGVIKLDGCTCQQVSSGPLHFNSVDYGDSAHLDEFLHRALVSPDREERNRRKLFSVAAGILTSTQSGHISPARCRVPQTASELRLA